MCLFANRKSLFFKSKIFEKSFSKPPKWSFVATNTYQIHESIFGKTVFILGEKNLYFARLDVSNSILNCSDANILSSSKYIKIFFLLIIKLTIKNRSHYGFKVHLMVSP